MERLTDPTLAGICPGRLPKGWHARAIFSNDDGARAWMVRMADSHSPENFPDLHQAYKDLLAGIKPFYSFVSFGPGGTTTDLNLLDAVSRDRPITYIPVDISKYLLDKSCRIMAGRYPMPMAIQADFEESVDFIQKSLPKDLERPAVFSILGNAVGNTDIGEQRLISNLVSLLMPGDYLFVSVATGRFDRMILKQKRELLSSGAIEHLLAGGLSMMTAEPYVELKKSMNSRLDVRLGESQVDGGTALTFFDRISGRDVFTSCRYDFKKMGHWFENRFQLSLVESRETLLPLKNPGVGSFLLCRKTLEMSDQ